MSNSIVHSQSYSRGVVYAVAAGIFMSVSGVLIRNLHTADAFVVLYYRSLAFFITVFLFMLLRDGRRTLPMFLNLGLRDFIVSVALAFSFIFYVLSIFHTTVANAVLLISTGPFFAALLGWFVLREAVGAKMLIAMVMAGSGVAVMMSGNPSASDIKGMFFAALAVFAFSIMVVTLRSSRSTKDMMAATALAGLVAAVFCVPFLSTLTISWHDLAISISLGSVQVGLGFILVTLASRSVPSAQIPLYILGETVLAPLWVWLLVDEVPEKNTLYGGALVFAAVVITSLVGATDAARATRDDAARGGLPRHRTASGQNGGDEKK